jgi:hypothetical protein
MLLAAPVLADNSVATHLDRIFTQAPGTPGGMGYLPLARAEAAIAREQVRAAQADSGDLAKVKARVAAAVNAIDPGLVGFGPGLGFGLREALRRMIGEVSAALLSAPTNANVTVQAAPVTVALQTALLRTDDAIECARQVLAAADVAAAERPLRRLAELLDEVEAGHKETVSALPWSQGAGGLDTAEAFLNQIAIGERPGGDRTP